MKIILDYFDWLKGHQWAAALTAFACLPVMLALVPVYVVSKLSRDKREER